MDRFENHLANKRNSSLDNFLRKNLPQIGDCGYIRYYEKCVIESKGAFLHSYIILTDERILITQNPPKNLTHLIFLSHILDIRLVPERHSVVLGGGPNVITSQHVHILFTNCENLKNTKISTTDQPPSDQFQLPSFIVSTYRSIGFSSSRQFSPDDIPKFILEESDDGSDSFDSPIRSNSVLEQNLSSWRIGNQNVNELKNIPKRPNSVGGIQLNENNNSGKKKYFSIKGKKETKNNEKSNIINEAHFHLYEAHSVLLNELFLYWNRQILKMTIGNSSIPLLRGLAASNIQSNFKILDDIVEAAEKITELIRIDPKFMQHKKTRAQIYSFVCDLYNDIQNPQLIRLCFQNSKLITSLISLLKFCTSQFPSKSFYQEFLSIQLIILEIFRVMIQVNTGTGYYDRRERLISFDRKGSIDWTLIMEELIKLIGRNDETYDIFVVSPKTELNSIIDIKCNISVSILYEIFSLFFHTPGYQHAIVDLLKDVNITRLASKSVTQIFNLVSHSKSIQMTPNQVVLLHQHICVLRNFMNHSQAVTQYLRKNYYEEFKYFVDDRELKTRIPDKYHMKPKVLDGIIKIRTEILSNY